MSEVRDDQNTNAPISEKDFREKPFTEEFTTSMESDEGYAKGSQEEILHLRAEVERLGAEVEKWREQALRVAADFENYRRRVQRDLPQQILQAQGDLMRAFLPVLDSIERGLSSTEKAPDLQKIQEGLRLTLHQLYKILERLDLQPIRPEIGDLPDPEKHEVLSTQPAPAGIGANVVLEVVEPGYLYKGLLLRPARIIVSE